MTSSMFTLANCRLYIFFCRGIIFWLALIFLTIIFVFLKFIKRQKLWRICTVLQPRCRVVIFHLQRTEFSTSVCDWLVPKRPITWLTQNPALPSTALLSCWASQMIKLSVIHQYHDNVSSVDKMLFMFFYSTKYCDEADII